MNEALAFVRSFDASGARQLHSAARQIFSECGTASPSPDLFARVGQAVKTLGDAVLDQCRPVDTADGLFVLTGLSLDDEAIGATPSHWATAGEESPHDIVLLLLSAAMGNPIAWPGQQNGRYVHNIVPARGHENEQTGASSTVLLAPHTEDAFHPGRASLLLLGCMRNHDRIATTAASIRRTRLDDDAIETLTRAEVPILPDDSYTEAQAYTRQPPPAVPTLFHADDGLTLRFDPAYTPLRQAPPPYQAAYRRLTAELTRVSVSIALSPGEILVIDNDQAVHGRVPFRPRYDGTDRWLKRASVRVPGRHARPPAEAAEHGYGQPVVEAHPRTGGTA
ncbi:TauD/TfdA family dioxygenase [Sphaerisporangium sp. NPDC051017]|uniref:TauD/TfdA family dioxygenase n=1 Tax=Sphaerisporangium sp. NPDC051017 TaxID=3154636 RepID=UPI00343C7A88